MTYYEKKRRKTSLTRSDVANYLNIDYKRYELIERGRVKMPKNLINKFNELMNKQKGEIKIDQLTREDKVNKWWDEISVCYGQGEYGLNKYMEEFNILNLTELGRLMGYKSACAIQQRLKGYGNRKTTYDFKNKLYSFFENELNIQPKHDSVRISNKAKTPIYISDCEKWLSHFDIKSYIKENDISQLELSRETGISQGTISTLIRFANVSSLYDKTIRKIQEYYERTPKAHEYFYPDRVVNTLGKIIPNDTTDITDDTTEPIESTDVEELKVQYIDQVEESTPKEVETIEEKPSLFDKLIDKYQTKLDDMNNSIEDCTKQITELQNKLSTLTKERIVYVDFINDLKSEEE